MSKNLFYVLKQEEQIDLKDKEIDMLRSQLRDIKKKIKDIKNLEDKFKTNNKYHSILVAWEKELDSIFKVLKGI